MTVLGGTGRRPACSASTPTAVRTESVVHAARPGDVVLLYTDGLVERRGQHLDDGPDPAGRAPRRARRPAAGRALRRPARRMLPGTPEDDVALVAVRLDRLRHGPDLTGHAPGRNSATVVGRAPPVGTPALPWSTPRPRGEGMGRHAWPLRPLPDGRGEVWRWDLGAVAELPAARAGLRGRLGGVGFPATHDDTAAERLVLAFDELASNALRHGEAPVVATVVAGSGGWLLDVSDRAPETMPAPAVDRDPAHGRHGPAPRGPAGGGARLVRRRRRQARLGLPADDDPEPRSPPWPDAGRAARGAGCVNAEHGPTTGRVLSPTRRTCHGEWGPEGPAQP